MVNIKNISSIYFAGIGGIGMSALARYFNQHGVKVSGYDKTPTPLTDKLIAEGISIHFIDDVNLIDKNADVVVYTPAIPAEHTELHFYKTNNYTLLKRSDVLGMLTADSTNICVAGTHGKTTTSAMIAHILTDTGYGCNAYLGGIAANYDTNFLTAPLNTEASKNNVSVVEADEYDRSFLKLQPSIAIVTAMDADHLDIYGTEKNMQDAFIEFSTKIKANGTLLIQNNVARANEFVADNILTYSAFDETADVHVANLKVINGSYQFDVVIKQKTIQNIVLNMGGMHNIENATAAIFVANNIGINEDKIKKAVANFKGVKRRFEYVISPSANGEESGEVSDEIVFIDDYAHHPEELRALIVGAKQLFPNKKCTVVFQPHLFSRTNDLAHGFAEVLSMADEAIVLPIYPARELPMPGITSSIILEKMTNNNKQIIEKNNLVNHLKNSKIELLITAGAGDIDTLIQPLKIMLQNSNGN